MFLSEILENKWVKLVLLLAGVVGAIWLIVQLQSVLSALMVAFILAYLCDPLADFFERLKLSRTASVAVVAFLIFVALGLFFVVLLPLFVRELTVLASDLPKTFDGLKASLMPRLQELLGSAGVELPRTFEEYLDSVKQHAPLLKDLSQRIWEPATKIVTSTFTGIVGTVVGLLNVIIIPVAWFYLLRDFDTIKARLAALVPARRRETVVDYAGRVDEVIQSFLQGQIIVALILGVIYGVGLQFVAGVPMGFVLGMMAGIASIVPYLGLILGIVPALLLAFLAHGDWLHPVLVVAVFAVAQLLEGNLITPKIVGEKVGLHPVTIIFSLLIFGQLFGFLGLLIAVPVTAVLMVFLNEALERYTRSAFFSAET